MKKSMGMGKRPGPAFKAKKMNTNPSNNNVNGSSGMSAAMANRSPEKPLRVVPAPTMKATLGPGSRGGC